MSGEKTKSRQASAGVTRNEQDGKQGRETRGGANVEGKNSGTGGQASAGMTRDEQKGKQGREARGGEGNGDERLKRCEWAEQSELEREYHDKKWGRPEHGGKRLFKMLMLEGMQAGLSWRTILSKMDALCAAFDDFDPDVLVGYGDEKVEELMGNPGIIRNRLKIKAVINNAKAYFGVCEKYGSFDRFLWDYVGGKPIVNSWERMEDIPAHTPLSDTISKDLKKLGFKFVGSTIVYAFMQSVGMVNDHMTWCGFYGG